jgi:archaeal flagellar protein FlaJ
MARGRLSQLFRKKRNNDKGKEAAPDDIEPDSDHDSERESLHERTTMEDSSRSGSGQMLARKTKGLERTHSRSAVERVAYNLFASRIPRLPGFRESFQQSGIPIIYESYLSTGFFASAVAGTAVAGISLLLEIRFLPRTPIIMSVLGSTILGLVGFAVLLVAWLFYPLQRKKSLKSNLENNLAYSFGIIGVLSSAGLAIDRLFENLATSESNPVLAELAKRFLRDVRVFGLDSETALKEVGEHSPSGAFSKMLNSIAVAFRTTGSVHDLVMFESSRLLQEKRDRLKKQTSNLSVMAELYITLVVVGPIIFIVMMAIFGLLPAGGLPDPVLVINIIVFIGIPALSIMMLILLDTAVGKGT